MKDFSGKAWRAFLLACGMLLFFSTCRADCGVSTYAKVNLVVYYDCDAANQPRLNIVLLDDPAPLKVIGRTLFSNSRGIDSLALDGYQLIVLTWDLVEIYNLKDPAHPVRTSSLHLKNQGSIPGYPRIEKIADNKLLLLGSVGAGELTSDGNPPKWELKDVPVSVEFRKKMGEWPPEHRFIYAGDEVVPVRETPEFRYELFWKSVNRPGESISRQYLRKVKKSSGHPLAELFLGQRVETID